MSNRRAIVATGIACLLAAAPAAAQLSGDITVNTTLTAAGSPYTVTGDVSVAAGVTLTIQPGVTVYIMPGDDQSAGADPGKVEIAVHGSLVMNGTPLSRVNIAPYGGGVGVWRSLGLFAGRQVKRSRIDGRKARQRSRRAIRSRRCFLRAFIC